MACNTSSTYRRRATFKADPVWMEYVRPDTRPTVLLSLALVAGALTACATASTPHYAHRQTGPTATPLAPHSTGVATPGFVINSSPINPYAYFKVTASSTRRNGFTLATAAREATVDLTSSQARRDATADFPSRRAPKIANIFLVRYRSLTESFEPPFDEYVSCWTVVFRTQIPGTPIVVSSKTGDHWTAILINARTGALEHTFSGQSSIG